MTTDDTDVLIVSASAWLFLCPVWIAYEDHESLMPLPRRSWLWPWFEANMAFQQLINLIVTFFEPEAGGFLFIAYREVEPFEIDLEQMTTNP